MRKRFLGRLGAVLCSFILIAGVIPAKSTECFALADTPISYGVGAITISSSNCSTVSGSTSITLSDIGGLYSSMSFNVTAKLVGADKTVTMTTSPSKVKAGTTNVTFSVSNATDNIKYEGGQYTIKLSLGLGLLSINLVENEIASTTVTVSGHSWTGAGSMQPSCEIDGYNKYYCSRCGCYRTDVRPATGHSWDNGEVTEEETCTADGVRTFTCSKCYDTYTEAIPMRGHSWDAGKVTKAARYLSTGVKTFTCSSCGEEKTQTIPKKNASAVTPAKVKITSAKPAKKKVTVKWKRIAKNTKGYQISIKNKSNGKVKNINVKQKSKATLSKTVSKLQSKKTYAVRIRAYNVVGGETIYGAWSAVKSGKVK